MSNMGAWLIDVQSLKRTRWKVPAHVVVQGSAVLAPNCYHRDSSWWSEASQRLLVTLKIH